MFDKKAFLGVLALAGLVCAQENYATWPRYKNLTINTTSSGANVPGVVTNFPILVRLTSSTDMNGISPTGADLRFTKLDGVTRLKHQIERFDTAAHAAEIWVLVDTVKGNDSTLIRVYWGKGGVADSSSGPQVFSPSNGFEAVYHLAEKGIIAGGTSADATGNGHIATAAINGTGTGATPPGDPTDGIGVGKSFNGNNTTTTANGGIGAYFTLTDTNTAYAGLNLNTKNGPWTVSAWVKPTACTFTTNSTTSGRYAIVSKYDANAGNKQWVLQANNVANQWKANYIPSNLTGGATGSEMSSATGNVCTANTWQFLTVSYYSATDPVLGTAPTATQFAVTHNGVAASAPVTGTNTFGNTAAVRIGASNDLVRMMNGSIDEVVISLVQRSPDWLKLSYETQKPGATAVVFGTTLSTSGAPSIGLHPQSQNVLVGARVVFKVAVSGTAPFTYKWVRRNTDTVGTNADSLVIATAAISDTGGYKVVVRNDSGQTVSNTAQLGVTAPVAVSVTQQPSDRNATVGSAVLFSVGVSGTPPFTYKWVKNNTDTVRNTTAMSSVNPNSTTDSLALSSVQFADSGNYKCVVKNSVNQVISNTVRLTVAPVSILPGISRGGSVTAELSGNTIVFRVPEGLSDVRLSVMDVWGRTLWSSIIAAGHRDASWNTKTNGGSLAGGVYLIRLTDRRQSSRVFAESRMTFTP